MACISGSNCCHKPLAMLPAALPSGHDAIHHQAAADTTTSQNVITDPLSYKGHSPEASMSPSSHTQSHVVCSHGP